jgi:hypothetical protein
MPTTKRNADEGIAVIRAANMVRITIVIIGTAPIVMLAFSEKEGEKFGDRMTKPAAEKPSKKNRPVRDFEAEFVDAQHKSTAGWVGIPCAAFRAAMIAACRTVGVVMTQAKMAVFVMPEGFDAADGTPLVRLLSPAPPVLTKMRVRNANGSTDLRIRPMWREWSASVTVEFDADMITAESVLNLLDRAGRQVGILEGRPFSRNSVGMGWGTFTVQETKKENVA